MISTIEALYKEQAPYIPKEINGMRAWIVYSEIYNTYGVRFYKIGSACSGMIDICDDHTAVKLIKEM